MNGPARHDPVFAAGQSNPTVPPTPDGGALREAADWMQDLADDGNCADWVIEKHRELAAKLRALAATPAATPATTGTPGATQTGTPTHPYVLLKRGLFWRPGDMGYTSRIEEAGRYTEEEARERAHDDGEPVTMRLASEFTVPVAEQLSAVQRDLSTARKELAEARAEIANSNILLRAGAAQLKSSTEAITTANAEAERLRAAAARADELDRICKERWTEIGLMGVRVTKCEEAIEHAITEIESQLRHSWKNAPLATRSYWGQIVSVLRAAIDARKGTTT